MNELVIITPAERRRQAFLYETQGLSEREIASKIGVSRSTVRRDLQRMNQALTMVEGGKSVEMATGRGHQRARKTKDNQSKYFGRITAIIPPEDATTNWQFLELDRNTLNTMPPIQLVELLANVSPPLSRAIWDYIRLLDAGHEIRVTRPGGEEVYPEASSAQKEFEKKLERMYGSIKILTGRLFMAGIVRGAMLAELVLDADRVPIDIAIPDPYSVRFRPATDSQRGQYWELGQIQDNKFVSLQDFETIRYLAHDPWPGKPYGRSPIMPGLFPCLFLLGLTHDLRRVVSQQGYPRIDIQIDIEKLAIAYPKDYKAQGDAWDKRVDQAMDDVAYAYSLLEPEDAFVHTNDSIVNRPVGALDGQSVQAADALIKSLERMAVQALKEMPLMLGITDGVSEANANRQWEIMVAGLKSLQHLAETILSELFRVGLEAQGFIADVKVRFAELRASEMLRDEQTAQLRSQNAAFMEDRQWLTPVEAATYGLGHEPSKLVAEELSKLPVLKEEPTQPVQGPSSAGEPTDGGNVTDVGETKSIRLVSGDRVYVLDPAHVDLDTMGKLVDDLALGAAD